MGQFITMMECHFQHLTGIMITGQEIVLRPTVQDGGTMTAATVPT